MNIFCDIETLPAQDPVIRQEILANVRPPATHKKAETINAWLAEHGEAEAEKKWRDTALDGTTGELLCIGLAVDDDPARVFWRRPGEPERMLLAEAFAFLQQIEDDDLRDLTWIGHNVQWDLRFLFQRAIVNGIRPPIPLRQDARINGGQVFDTMTAWAGYGQRISLDRLCKALAITSPKSNDVNGSTVVDMVMQGRYEEIVSYCAKDVEATREVYRRMTFVSA